MSASTNMKKQLLRLRRKAHIRKNVEGSQERPRLSVYRSLNHIYAQVIDDVTGKTLAAAYSARGSEYAGVSTPLAWREIDAGVKREDFTIATVPSRLREVGDLWKPLREAKGVDLSRVERYAAGARGS